jgi:hypothetical protein
MTPVNVLIMWKCWLFKTSTTKSIRENLVFLWRISGVKKVLHRNSPWVWWMHGMRSGRLHRNGPSARTDNARHLFCACLFMFIRATKTPRAFTAHSTKFTALCIPCGIISVKLALNYTCSARWNPGESTINWCSGFSGQAAIILQSADAQKSASPCNLQMLYNEH